MKERKCINCKKVKPSSEYNKSSTALDGLQSWCMVCSRVGHAKRKGEWWALEGFESATDHFNAALEHYAKIFNCPTLIKHKVNSLRDKKK